MPLQLEVLENQIGLAARRYAETHDEKYKREVVRLSLWLADLHALAILEDALKRCRNEDMRKPEVYGAVKQLSRRSVSNGDGPFDKFRDALGIENEDTRWENLNTALNGIRQVVF